MVCMGFGSYWGLHGVFLFIRAVFVSYTQFHKFSPMQVPKVFTQEVFEVTMTSPRKPAPRPRGMLDGG